MILKPSCNKIKLPHFYPGRTVLVHVSYTSEATGREIKIENVFIILITLTQGIISVIS